MFAIQQLEKVLSNVLLYRSTTIITAIFHFDTAICYFYWLDAISHIQPK